MRLPTQNEKSVLTQILINYFLLLNRQLFANNYNMFRTQLMRPFGAKVGKVSFFNNANLVSLSLGNMKSSLKPSLMSLAPVNSMRSNIQILQSSMNPLLRVTSISVSHTKRTMVSSSRRLARNDTWTRYNRYYKNTRWNKLKGPAIFTALFCIGTTIATPYLFDYTPLAYFKRHPSNFVYALIALNGGVFLMWRVPALSRFVHKYAIVVKDRLQTNWAMLGSSFSHQSFMHLFVNMFVLQSFGTSLAVTVGVANFTVLYLNAAVLSSFVSIAIPTLMRSSLASASLGASGAIFAVMGAFSYLFPHAPIGFFFIPIPGGAWTLFLGLTGWNIAGTILRWGTYDYAAHLGGSIVGIFYGWWFNKKRQEAFERRRSSFRF